MVVAFDNSVLCLLLHPGVDIPNDPATGNPVSRAQDRIAYLVEQLRESRSRILIPTPVLAEFLTFASADYLEEINSSAHFQIIYTTDSDLGTIAEAFALTTAHVAELELPPPRTPLLETLDD